MSLPESLGSIYESIARVWRARFIGAAMRGPHREAGLVRLCKHR